METDNDTFYCSFVSTHYIICECGENFPTDEALREHLENGHKTIKKEKQVVVVKQEPSGNDVEHKVLVYSDSRPLHINGRPVYIISRGNVKKELVIKEGSARRHANSLHVSNMQKDVKSEDEDLTQLEGHLEQHHAEEIKQEIIYELKPEDLAEASYIPLDLPDDDIPGQYETVVTTASLLQAGAGGDHDYGIEGTEEREYIQYFCDVCGKGFGTEKAVRHHKYRMHRLTRGEREQRSNIKRTVCEVCGKKYASQAALRYHQRVHTGEKPYPCTECDKRFTMPLFLQIHLRTHTGERPYECALCPKAFSNQAALLRHDRVHTGVKPYTCPECGKSFSQSNSMKLHVRTVHLRLPAPYKSRTRRLQAQRRAAAAAAAAAGAAAGVAAGDADEQVLYLDGDAASMLCETIEAPRAIIP